MLALNAIAEKENAAETLLMAKGCRSVVSITDGKVDVVVNAPSITESAARADRGYCKTENRDIGEKYRDFPLNLGD